MVLNTETVFFTPYQPLGFRIALFGFADFGLLGRDANIFKNNFYTTFGLGVRLRNERLVFSTIQLRLGVALGKGGWADCRYFQASNGTRMEQYRYLPSRPEIVRFRLIPPRRRGLSRGRKTSRYVPCVRTIRRNPTSCTRFGIASIPSP